MKKYFSGLLVFLFLSAGTAFSAGGLGPVKIEVPQKFREGVFKQERSLEVPPGFRVSVFAAGLEGARFMAADKDGTIYLSVPKKGEVLALPDKDHDGAADEVKVFAKGLRRPHGLAFKDGELIVAETGRLLALKIDKSGLKSDSKRVISEDLPTGGGHWTRTVVVGPDGAFYVSAGASCNACVEDDKRRAAVLRIPEAKAEVFATGLRNSVGIEFEPKTGELWGVDNGRDMLGDDLPPEELNLIKKGGNYGWPHCYGDKIPDPEFGSPERCSKTMPPVIEMQAHSAPLGIAFGYGFKAPEEYRDCLFIAFHGSWNRTVPTGYKVVAVPFRNGKPIGKPFDFVRGWRTEDGEVWGRPVDVMTGADGALYVSDDQAGAIYRVTYSGGR